jgi:dTDP-glucose 4,6-dehydratase
MLKNVEAKQFPVIDRPERFNIVGEKRISNLDIAKLVAGVMGKELKYELVDAHSSRPGHDPHYGLDGKKLESYGYKFPTNLEQSMWKTIMWSLDNPRWLS